MFKRIKKNFKLDYLLTGIILILLFGGILILSSVSALISQENFGNTTYYLFHQIKFGIIPGFILGFFAFLLPLKTIKKLSWIAVFVNLLLVVLVFIPGIGIVSGGASRWLNFKFFSFQPSEFLKITFILYIAAWLSSPARKISDKKEKNLKHTLIPFIVISLVVGFLLAKQSDISTLGVIILPSLIMYFCSNTPFWHAFLIFLIGAGGLAVLIKIAPYRIMRLKIMLGMVEDPMNLGYQIKQILIGIGSGGIFGLGLGMSNQKFGFIPEIMSDSIFAIFAEEVGFIGSVALIGLFTAFFWRGFSIAKKSKTNFSKLFAIGFSSWIYLQALINIAAMVKVIPLTGIPLPFISYGGSHVVTELIGVGILLNISKNIEK